MKERRQHLRVRVRQSAVCELDGPGSLPAVVADVSLGGARLECDAAPEYGAKLTVVVQLPGATDPSRLPGTVRWTSPGVFGVQFGPLGARDTHHLARLIAREALPTLRPSAPAGLPATGT